MAASESNFNTADSDEDLDSDGVSQDNIDVKVNIAIFGEAESGRSSFVNIIRGVNGNTDSVLKRDEHKLPMKELHKWLNFYLPKETDQIAAEKGKRGELTCRTYCCSEDTSVNFTILPSIDETTFPTFKPFVDHVKLAEFDAFLIITADTFSRRHLIFLKAVQLEKKPFFLIRTKIDNHVKEQKRSDNNAMPEEMKAILADDFTLDESEIYLISNHRPEKWDFSKLMNAVADALPPAQQERFSSVPSIEKLIDLQEFQMLLKGIEEQENNVREMRELFLKSGIAGVQRMMTQKLVEWKNVKINLAILGNSGAGKSSFINAIRGVDDDDIKLAADTGLTETTMKPTPYGHPTNTNILFWDLPGIGTPNYPDLPTFCEKVGIEKYDTFLILCHMRFTENDLTLAKKVKSMGKSFFFVRTKVDSDIQSEKRKKSFNEEKVLKKLKDNCVQNLATSAIATGEKEVFLISSWYPAKWDFESLKKAISDQLPAKQKEALMLSLQAKSKEFLGVKIKLLQDRVYMAATASVKKKRWRLVRTLKYICEKSFMEEIHSYRSQLAFPRYQSEEFKMLSKCLQQKVIEIDPNGKDLLEWLKRFDRSNEYELRKRNMKYIVAKTPTIFVSHCLKSILTEMEKIALDILVQATERAVDGEQ